MHSCTPSLRRAKALLGTLVDIRVAGEGGTAHLIEASSAAFRAISRVHRLMSFHDPGSDVSRLNREAHQGPVTVDPGTWAVLARAGEIAHASNGAFDVTIAPRLVAWGLLPAPVGAPPPDPGADWRAVELLAGHRVRFRTPLWLDLGGIAKGHAVDCACAALRAHDVHDYVVNAGGDLAIGSQPTPVQVRDPDCPGVLLRLGVYARVAVATSATYYAKRATAAGTVHPIVAPASGAPAAYGGSISVLAPDAMTADALTKVLAVAGRPADPLLARYGARAAFVRSTRTIWYDGACAPAAGLQARQA